MSNILNKTTFKKGYLHLKIAQRKRNHNTFNKIKIIPSIHNNFLSQKIAILKNILKTPEERHNVFRNIDGQRFVPLQFLIYKNVNTNLF